MGALRAARRQLARYAPGADVLLVHDPELLLVLPLVRRLLLTIWDVHEDTAAALGTKAWLPPRCARWWRRRYCGPSGSPNGTCT